MESMPGTPIPVEAALGLALRIHPCGGIIVRSKAVVREGGTHHHGITLGGWGGTPHVGYHVLVTHANFSWSLGRVACISMQKTFMY